MSRIQITREQFLSKIVDVEQPPNYLKSKLEKPPLCHILSTYVILPVASDTKPFFIHHKNKQPIIANKKYLQRQEESSGDSDDEFQKVKTDKKRVKRNPQPVQTFTPVFPASDPSKVIIVGEKKEAPKPA